MNNVKDQENKFFSLDPYWKLPIYCISDSITFIQDPPTKMDSNKNFLTKLIPDFFILLLDDLGDWAEEEADRRELLELETDYQHSLRKLSDRLNRKNSIEIQLIVESLDEDTKAQFLDAFENLDRGSQE